MNGALALSLAALVFSLAVACSLSLLGPNASIEVSVQEGQAPLDVAFNGNQSFDPDGQIVIYRWDFGDGEVAAGVQVSHTYQQPGNYSVVLEVTDDDGLVRRATAAIHVAAEPEEAPDALVFGDYVTCMDQAANGVRVAELVWVRPTYARLRLLGGGHGERIWEKNYRLDEIVQLTQDDANALNLIPEDYYTRDEYGILPNTLEGLELLLDNFRYTSVWRGTTENENYPNPGDPFEATEMAAALECALEDAGFDARIVMGPSPQIRVSGDHAWVIVFLPAQTLAIEPTESSLQPQKHEAIIVAQELSLCPYYYHPENEIFYDIYAAVAAHSLEPFDWWLVETPP